MHILAENYSLLAWHSYCNSVTFSLQVAFRVDEDGSENVVVWMQNIYENATDFSFIQIINLFNDLFIYIYITIFVVRIVLFVTCVLLVLIREGSVTTAGSYQRASSGISTVAPCCR